MPALHCKLLGDFSFHVLHEKKTYDESGNDNGLSVTDRRPMKSVESIAECGDEEGTEKTTTHFMR